MKFKRPIAVLLAVVVVSLLSTGLVFATDAGDDFADMALQTENPTPYEPTANASTDEQYEFRIKSISECGTTCRDVTASLRNTGDVSLTNVVVETRLYAKNDLLWRGNSTVGALPIDESYTATERVELGFRDAADIQRNDGYVTIQTIIHTDEGRTVYQERRKVI